MHFVVVAYFEKEFIICNVEFTVDISFDYAQKLTKFKSMEYYISIFKLLSLKVPPS